MWHLSLEGDWSVVVLLFLAKRESSTHYLDNEPWERKLARTSTVVGPEGFPKLFHPHIYLGLGPFSLKNNLLGFWFSSRAHIRPPTPLIVY